MKSFKIKKVKIFTFFIILLILISIIYFIKISYPTLQSNSESAAFSKANNIMNKAVIEVMKNYKYSDFFSIEKDKNGKVVLIQSNVVALNNAVNQIIEKIQYGIDNAPTTTIYINYGSISGLTILKNFGPKFNIELETAGNIDTELESEFESTRYKSDHT